MESDMGKISLTRDKIFRLKEMGIGQVTIKGRGNWTWDK